MHTKMYILAVIAICMVSCSQVQNDVATQEGLEEPTGIYPFFAVDEGQVGSIHSQTSDTFDEGRQTAFTRIDKFECSAVAYAKLGSPVLQSKTVPNGLRLENIFNDDSKAYPIAQYLVWRNAEAYYCLGFDELGQVISKDVAIQSNATN